MTKREILKLAKGMLIWAALVTGVWAMGSTYEGPKADPGIIATPHNPYVYVFGQPTKVEVTEDSKFYFTTITYNPYGSSLLYKEKLTFCGDISDDFGDTGVQYIITYERKVLSLHNGTSCRNVYRVVEIQLPEPQ